MNTINKEDMAATKQPQENNMNNDNNADNLNKAVDKHVPIILNPFIQSDLDKKIITIPFNGYLFSMYSNNGKWEYKLVEVVEGKTDEEDEENDIEESYNLIGDVIISKKPIWSKMSNSIVKKIKLSMLKTRVINSTIDVDNVYMAIKTIITNYINQDPENIIFLSSQSLEFKVTNVTQGELNDKRIENRNNKFTPVLPKGHFIKKCMDWTSDITDGYQEYSLMGSLWLLSALDNNTMIFNLKQEQVKLNIWAFIIGNSSTSRKTTTMSKFRKIYEEITHVKVSDTDYSQEGLIDELSAIPTKHQVRDEASGVLAKMHKKYNDGIFALECTFYDNRNFEKILASVDKESGEPNKITVENPYLTKLYATTPDKIAKTMLFEDFSCGWGFRFMFCNPKYNKPRMPFELNSVKNDNEYEIVMNHAYKIHQHFLSIKSVDEKLKINEFKISQETLTYLDNICIKWETEAMHTEDDSVESLNARGNTLMMKLAMLYEIGKEEISTTITKEGIDFAASVVEYSIKCAKEILELLEEDVKNNQIEKITVALRRKGGACAHSELLRKTKMKSKDFIDCINTLIESKTIEVIEINGIKGRSYMVKK